MPNLTSKPSVNIASRDQKGIGMIVVIFAVVIVAVLGVLFLINRKPTTLNQTSNVTPTTTSNSISNNKATVSKRHYGRYYSVEPGTTWQALTAPYAMYQDTLEEVAFKLDANTVVSIQATKTDYTQALNIFAGYNPVSTIPIVVAGHKATRFDYNATNASAYRTRIVVQGTGTVKSYLIDFVGNDKTITEAVINQVVSTFKTI